MNKKELCVALKENFELTGKKSEEILNFILEKIEETLVKEESVELYNFGKFEVVERAERTGRNPKTGEEITIPAKKAIKFKTSKYLNDKIN